MSTTPFPSVGCSRSVGKCLGNIAKTPDESRRGSWVQPAALPLRPRSGHCGPRRGAAHRVFGVTAWVFAGPSFLGPGRSKTWCSVRAVRHADQV